MAMQKEEAHLARILFMLNQSSRVAATESPIIFMGSGEHFDDLEPFDPRSFIRRLLGLGDLPQLFEKVKEAIPMDKQQALMKSLQKGKFTLKHLREQYQVKRI